MSCCVGRSEYNHESYMEEVVGIDDHQIVKQFSRDDIIQLLQYTSI